MAALPQFPRPHSKHSAKKNLIGSEAWRRPAKCLELAPRGELKKRVSLVFKGRQPVTAD
jgi:hypothetical protein